MGVVGTSEEFKLSIVGITSGVDFKWEVGVLGIAANDCERLVGTVFTGTGDVAKFSLPKHI